MVKLIILFRSGVYPAEFDQHYNQFLMMLDELPDIRKKTVNQVYAGPGGTPAFSSVIELFFDDREALQAALLSEEGKISGVFLKNFAAHDSVTLFADALEESYE